MPGPVCTVWRGLAGPPASLTGTAVSFRTVGAGTARTSGFCRVIRIPGTPSEFSRIACPLPGQAGGLPRLTPFVDCPRLASVPSTFSGESRNVRPSIRQPDPRYGGTDRGLHSPGTGRREGEDP